MDEEEEEEKVSEGGRIAAPQEKAHAISSRPFPLPLLLITPDLSHHIKSVIGTPRSEDGGGTFLRHRE